MNLPLDPFFIPFFVMLKMHLRQKKRMHILNCQAQSSSCKKKKEANSQPPLVHTGEWEISAFDGNLKSRGMSVRYTVKPCDTNPLVDEEDDLTAFIDNVMSMGPRAAGPHNLTAADGYRNINSPLTPDPNVTTRPSPDPADHDSANEIMPGSRQAENATVTLVARDNSLLEGGIPQEVLDALERDEHTDGINLGGQGRARKRRRAVDGKQEVWTDERDGASVEGEVREDTRQAIGMMRRNGSQAAEADENAEKWGNMTLGKNETRGQENNHSLDDPGRLTRMNNTAVKLNVTQQPELDLQQVNLVVLQPEEEVVDPVTLRSYNHTDNSSAQLAVSLEYEDYGAEVRAHFFSTSFNVTSSMTLDIG